MLVGAFVGAFVGRVVGGGRLHLNRLIYGQVKNAEINANHVGISPENAIFT